MPQINDIAAENLQFNSNCNPQTCVVYHAFNKLVEQMEKQTGHILHLENALNKKHKLIDKLLENYELKNEIVKTLLKLVDEKKKKNGRDIKD